MDNSLKVLIPLRGGSKGIKRKNLKSFLSKPLFFWVTKAALEAKLEVIISTEDDEIKKEVKFHFPKVIIQNRPKELAEDKTSTEDVIRFFIEEFYCEHIMLLQATSPLTTTKDILSSKAEYFKSNSKPLLSGTRQYKFCWNNKGEPLNYDPFIRPRRQDWYGTFVENGAIYIFKRKDFNKFGTRCNPPCTLFEMDNINSLELDFEEDWKTLEKIAKNNQYDVTKEIKI